MRYFLVETTADRFYARAVDEQSKQIDRLRNGQWIALLPVYSIAYWRGLGHTIEEVTEADANGE